MVSVSDHGERLEPLLPGVSRHHLREVRPGGLEVVVVAVHAYGGQVVNLLLGEHAKRAGDLDVHSFADCHDSLADLRHELLVRTPDGGDDAELSGPGCGGLDCGLDQRGDVEPGSADGGGEQAALGAEVAVFGAASGFEADDALDLNLRAAPRHPDLVRELQQLRQPVVTELQTSECLLLSQPHPMLQHLLTHGLQHTHQQLCHLGLLYRRHVLVRRAPCRTSVAQGRDLRRPGSMSTFAEFQSTLEHHRSKFASVYRLRRAGPATTTGSRMSSRS